MTGHSLLSSSLALLLSYRTNSAYGRFWEARGHWTKTKSTCRNLAVVMKAHIEPHSPKSTAKFLGLLAAFPATLMHLCLGGAVKLPDHAQKYLPYLPVEYRDQPALPAIWLCMQLQKAIRDAELESRTAQTNLVEAAHHNEIAHLIDSLMDSMSSCEKILRTPLPWTYSRHTSRFLTLWMGTLPFALVGTLDRWLVMAIVIAASYCMLGIEEIGHLIEQPFLGDPLYGVERTWFKLDPSGDGEAPELIKRGRTTKPYDIGIPVCSLAAQIRREVELIAAGEGGAKH
jgi:putative membrane protein